MRLVFSGGSAAQSAAWIPSVDVRETADKFVVQADLPGVEANDIEITTEKGVLTIKGERKYEQREESQGYERVERVSGSFLRRFTLPDNVQLDKIEARYTNGVLEVKLPKAAEQAAKRITVQAA
ncbi:MAG: Hsp20/alpha crystallin family protein [Steroidobacteraceae bacterium]